jgi:hypothetical protein
MIAFVVGVLLQVQQVQMGIEVRPDTVTVGEHFIATVRVRAPLGTTLKFPIGTATPANVDTAGAMRRRDTTTSSYTETTVAYRLAAWRIGVQRLGLGDVVVSTPTGDRQISLANASVFVKSVLPADTALRKPKPPRPPFTLRTFNWLPWLVAAVAALLLAAIWWFWRRYRGRGEAALAPLSWAEREFKRVEAMQLIERRETERHAILMAGVLRGYLEREFPHIRASATTRELVTPLHGVSAVPLERTLRLFERADLLKFAGERITVDEAIGIANESKSLVRRIDAQVKEAQAKANVAESEQPSQSEAA